MPEAYDQTAANFVPNALSAALERQPTEEEWSHWTDRLTTAQVQGSARLVNEAKTFVRSQFYSEEYINRNRSDEDFIADLYSAYLQREPDEGGYNAWLGVLRNTNAQGGNGREVVLRGFEESTEFMKLVTSLTPVMKAFFDLDGAGDYDGDGKTDYGVWRASNGAWHIWQSSTNSPKEPRREWGAQSLGDIPVPGDYDGDGKTDYAVWRASTAVWHVWQSSTNSPREPRQQWGLEEQGDIPVPGDYDGDGKTDYAVWRPSDGTWHVWQSSTNSPREPRREWGGQAYGDVSVSSAYIVR